MFDLGLGWSFLMADVGNSSPAPSPAVQLSYGLSIRQPVLPYLSITLDFATGRFFGEKALGDTGNINYQTSVITQDLRLTYEASHLFNKNDKGFIPHQPYVGVGVGLVSWRAKGDLKDASGNTYHHWSDGFIRDLPEDPANFDQATIIERDMTYESDLRDANLDGFGRYDQMALHVPIELGFRYQFTKRVGAHIKGIYHLNFTDLIDNITSESVADRAGTAGNDNHISAMLGVSVFLGEYQKPKRKKKPKKKEEPKEDLIASDREKTGKESDETESEKEQIADTETETSSDSEENETISESQSKSDSESSIETNAKTEEASDQEVQSEKGAERETSTTSVEGVTQEPDGSETSISESEIAASNIDSERSSVEPSQGESPSESDGATDQETTETTTETDVTEEGNSDVPATEAVADQTEADVTANTDSEIATDNGKSSDNDAPSEASSTQKDTEMSAIDLIDKTMGIESTEPKLAGSYHWADLNKDRYISADEVLHFIDLLFDGDSKYTVPMIHELIEYYFDQD